MNSWLLFILIILCSNRNAQIVWVGHYVITANIVVSSKRTFEISNQGYLVHY